MAWLYKQKGSENWWVGYRANGKQFLRSTGTSNKKQAEMELARIRSAYEAHKSETLTEEFVRLLTKSKREKTPVRRQVSLWMKDCKSLSAGTIERYRGVLEDFCKSIGATEEKPMLEDITKSDLRTFLRDKAEMSSRGNVKLNHRVLSAFFNHAIDNEVLKETPLPSLKSLKIDGDGATGEQTQRRSFTLAEVQLLYSKAPTDFWRYMVLAGFYTGQRLGDLISVTWSGVDLETMTLHLIAQKTGKSMHIPIRGALGGLLRALASEGGTKRPKGPIWPAEKGRYEKSGAGAFSSAFCDLMLVPAGLAAPRKLHTPKTGRGSTRQLSAVSFHCFRHTFVSMIKLSGGSQAVAKELAGHSSDRVSDLYTHCPPESLKSAIDLLPEVAV